ncbi:hypothetical protein MPDQ_002949 [Monascus purpureus]|uniref:Uncharacterized protein n=1 Tax=Monascus purpureus TaxID=5098 RepID=A0A507QJJ6_MONPU|nr:hypothetical protein MPDQ_002949 [Monascus purpureus]BDD57181.1 hypothetical protein MAP00_002570 [Monascus purpureus]
MAPISRTQRIPTTPEDSNDDDDPLFSSIRSETEHPSPLLRRDTKSARLDTQYQYQYQTISIPATYADLNNSLAPGTVAGIILGSVAGFIVIAYFLYVAFGGTELPIYRIEVGATRRRSARVRGDADRRREVAEFVRPIAARRGRGQRHRAPPPPPRDTIIVDESVTSRSRTDDGGDIVEVIEEHSSPPRRSSRGSRR